MLSIQQCEMKKQVCQPSPTFSVITYFVTCNINVYEEQFPYYRTCLYSLVMVCMFKYVLFKVHLNHRVNLG